MTYARRYGLMCMAGIAPEDDDGNAAASAPPPKQQAKPSGPTDEQIAHERAAHDAQVMIESAESLDDLASVWKALGGAIQRDSRVSDAKEKRKAQLTTQNADLGGDAIPH